MTRDEILAALDDRQTLRVLLEGECRGEPILGQLAVGCVVRNRVKSGRFASTYKGVCLQPAQFSCFWGTGANVDHVYNIAEKLLGGDEMTPQLAWVTTGIAGDFLAEDVVHGAVNYLEESLWMTNPPAWARTMRAMLTIGHHVFLAPR